MARVSICIDVPDLSVATAFYLMIAHGAPVDDYSLEWAWAEARVAW